MTNQTMSSSSSSTLLLLVLSMVMTYQPWSGVEATSTFFADYYRDDCPHVLKATIKRELPMRREQPSKNGKTRRRFVMKLRQNFKGCPPSSTTFLLHVSATENDADFVVNHTYAIFAASKKDKEEEEEEQDEAGIFGDARRNVLYTANVAMSSMMDWSKLSVRQRKFLLGREYTCNDESFCGHGNNGLLNRRCRLSCPPCSEDNPNVICDKSLCRGCSTLGVQILNATTFEPLRRTQTRKCQ